MQRAQRKLEHLKYALELGDGPCSTHLHELRFLHNCLPELNPADIDFSMEIYGKQLRLPFFIDAITGGTEAVATINQQLAEVARRLGIGMAVGSQYGAVKSGEGLGSYEVVRKTAPDICLLANVSALATPEQAQAAVDMLQADALEIHMNAAQELFMTEGDQDFSGLLTNMDLIRESVSVPVIAKETGCGIAKEQYIRLRAAGFTSFDCAGAGGTNFPAIEAKRAGTELGDFADWGIPTCWSLIDAAVVIPSEHILLASGGLRTGEDVAKAFALGADAVCLTGSVLSSLQQGGVDAACDYLEQVALDLKRYMILLGCRTVAELRSVPLVMLGETIDYCHSRGYDVEQLCRDRRE